MNNIEFDCPICEHHMSIGAESAGRRARCPKCQSPLVIPSPSKPAGVPSPAGAPRGGTGAYQDEEEGAYGLQDEPQRVTDDDDFEEELPKDDGVDPRGGAFTRDTAATEKEIRARRRKELAILRKAPADPAQWSRARHGLTFALFGVVLFAGSYFCQKIVIFGGFFSSTQYAYVVQTQLVDAGADVVAGQQSTLYRVPFGLAMIGGEWMLTLSRILFIVSYLLFLGQLVCYGFGSMAMTAGPRERGLRTIALFTLGFAVVSGLFVFFLRLLPTTGLTSYTIMQLITPEVALTNANMGRLEPIHVTFSASPFWEGLLVLMLRSLDWVVPALIGTYMRYSALVLQDEELEKKAHGVIKLALALAFIDATILMLCHSGTSDILIGLLRFCMAIYMIFQVWFFVWMALVIWSARDRMYRTIRFVTMGEKLKRAESA